MMKKYAVLAVLFLVLGGCVAQKGDESLPGGETQEARVGSTTLEGKLNATDKGAIISVGGKMQELESYSVDFSEYDGKVVEVTGEFSGDTLFVDKVQLK